MTLVPVSQRGRRYPVRLPTWSTIRAWNRAALLVRVVQVLAGAALFLLPPHHHLVLDALVVLGTGVAVVSPARNGQSLVLIGAIGSWYLSGDVHVGEPAGRVLPFALALFVIHNATALAATVPLGCELRPELLRRWLSRSGLTLVISAVLIGLLYLVEAVTSGTTGPVLELIGVAGVLVVVIIAAVLFSRLLRSDG